MDPCEVLKGWLADGAPAFRDVTVSCNDGGDMQEVRRSPAVMEVVCRRRLADCHEIAHVSQRAAYQEQCADQ